MVFWMGGGGLCGGARGAAPAVNGGCSGVATGSCSSSCGWTSLRGAPVQQAAEPTAMDYTLLDTLSRSQQGGAKMDVQLALCPMVHPAHSSQYRVAHAGSGKGWGPLLLPLQ